MTAIADQHRVTRLVTGVRDQLGQVSGVPLYSMDADETTATIADVLRAEAQLAELKTRLVNHAETLDLPGHAGGASTGELAGPPHHRQPSRRPADQAARRRSRVPRAHRDRARDRAAPRGAGR